MDGDLAPLAASAGVVRTIRRLAGGRRCARFRRARARMAAARWNISALRSPYLVYMGTLGKAAGVGGAFVAAHATVIEWLVQRARPYIYHHGRRAGAGACAVWPASTSSAATKARCAPRAFARADRAAEDARCCSCTRWQLCPFAHRDPAARSSAPTRRRCAPPPPCMSKGCGCRRSGRRPCRPARRACASRCRPRIPRDDVAQLATRCQCAWSAASERMNALLCLFRHRHRYRNRQDAGLLRAAARLGAAGRARRRHEADRGRRRIARRRLAQRGCRSAGRCRQRALAARRCARLTCCGSGRAAHRRRAAKASTIDLGAYPSPAMTSVAAGRRMRSWSKASAVFACRSPTVHDTADLGAAAGAAGGDGGRHAARLPQSCVADRRSDRGARLDAGGLGRQCASTSACAIGTATTSRRSAGSSPAARRCSAACRACRPQCRRPLAAADLQFCLLPGWPGTQSAAHQLIHLDSKGMLLMSSQPSRSNPPAHTPQSAPVAAQAALAGRRCRSHCSNCRSTICCIARRQVHREHFDPNEVQLSTLLSIKTGGCRKTAAIARRRRATTPACKAEKLMAARRRARGRAQAAKAQRRDALLHGRRLARAEGPRPRASRTMMRGVKAMGLETCATLGMLEATARPNA